MPPRWIFLLQTISARGDGIVHSAMRRAKLVAEHLEQDVYLFSCDWARDSQARELELRRLQLIPTSTRMINLFNSMLVLHRDSKISAFPRSAQLVLPAGVSPRSEKSDAGLIRRVYMSRLHKLHRHEYYNEHNELLCRYEIDVSAGQADGLRITVFDKYGTEQGFDDELSFREYILSLLMDDGCCWNIVVDKNSCYKNLLASPHLKEIEKKVFCVIHSTHLETDGERVKPHYRAALGNHQGSDAIIALTHRQAEDIRKQGVPDEKIVVIPHARNLHEGWSDDGRRIPGRIICLARYSPIKRHKLMFEIFAEVIKLAPHASLHTYGGGPLKKSLQQLVKSMGLDGKIVLHDHAADVESIYHEAELSILTSVEEGFSLFAIESIAHGVPMAALDIKYGPQDMLAEPRCGVLVDQAEPMKMVQEIADLLNNEQSLNALRANIPAAAAKFSEQKAVALWRQLINE